MALDSNGRIGKWSHMRSNLEDFDFWVLFLKKYFSFFKIGKKVVKMGQIEMRLGLSRTLVYETTEYDGPGGSGIGSKFGFRGFPMGLVFRGHF